YFGSERSVTLPAATTATIRYIPDGGEAEPLRDALELQKGEVIDTAVLRRDALRTFIAEQIADAKKQGVLFSIHLKATMMKVSDPIIFGHAVDIYFRELFETYADTFARLGISPNNGLGDLYKRIESLPAAEQQAIRDEIDRAFDGPDVSMVDSDRGITNFHVPSDFIIDATFPAAIRTSGRSWAPDGSLQDTKFVIPDRSYSGVYQTVIDDCKAKGAFDPRTMGSVYNIGLMAQKAEEYGSHDKTFEITGPGRVEVVDADGTVLMEQRVDTGDIFRMCQVKDKPVQEWIKLAVNRSRATGAPAIFWLNENRAHDAELIRKVREYLPLHDTAGLDISILAPEEATKVTVDRLRKGQDTISVTGNVLRDYLTDLFPILELGTSSKMLSIVPLMNGGRLYETGAAGSAPKHVQQFVSEGHLRWDSLGEFLALAVSFEHLAESTGPGTAKAMADALDHATGRLLEEGKSPSRKVNELDNRGSHYYLARYWAEALAEGTEDNALRERFAGLARELAGKEQEILTELATAQGSPVELGGYYHPDEKKADAAMRPSPTLNGILEQYRGR
ncbi:MAG: NADP-dependent isocitrate dehydrogenase, partial [Alkalispirochaeta sp.]